MPKLSDTMEEGTVLEWKKQDGAQVKRGDVLAEIESDKASFEIEAEADGALHIVVEQGKAVPVGQQIATIGEAAGGGKAKGKAAPQERPTKPKAEKEPEEQEQPQERLSPAARREASADGEKASPLARRLARERGVDLASIKGSGPGGRRPPIARSRLGWPLRQVASREWMRGHPSSCRSASAPPRG